MKKGGSDKSADKKQEPLLILDLSHPYDLINALSQNYTANVIEALKNLKRFTHMDFINDLLDRGLLNKLVVLIEDKKSVAAVIELSLDLLSCLLNFNSVINFICENEQFIHNIFVLLKTKPKEIQVECLKCLSLLSREERAGHYFVETCDFNFVLSRLSQNDPDIQACILKIVNNLVKDIEIAEKIINLPNFSFVQYIKLLSNDYPLVQHRALNLIHWLTSYEHVTILRQIFVDDNGTAALLKLLETHKWPDLHEKAFKVLINISTIDKMFSKLGEEGVKNIIKYVDGIESQRLQFASFNAILKMTKNSSFGLSMFLQNGIFDLISEHLIEDSKSSMLALAVSGMAVISQHSSAISKLEENPDLFTCMLNITTHNKEMFDWLIRTDAANSVYSIISRSKLFLQIFIEKRYWELIINILFNDLKKAPYKMLLILCKIMKFVTHGIYNYLNCPSEICTKFMVVLKQFIMSPQINEFEVKSTAAGILEDLVEYPEFREDMKKKNMYRSLAQLLFRTAEIPSVIEAYLKLFISLSEWDQSFVDDLAYVLAIDWFIKKKELIRSLPIARRFLDLVFDKCKHIKIHFTNRLDLWDKIQSGFYLHRACTDSLQNNFTPLKTIIREKYSKSRPVYFINFDDNEHLMGDVMKKIIEGSNITHFDLISTNGQAGKSDRISCACDVEHFKDPFLKAKLEELKTIFGYPADEIIPLNLTSVLDRIKYLEKVKILSDFVYNNLSKIDNSDEECTNHSFELHISEIKKELDSPVIPIGYLKLGTKFEKALLFKTLGDQVGIPSALIRSRCGGGWNEIYLPPKSQQKEEEDVLSYDLSIDQTRSKSIFAKRRTTLSRKSTVLKTITEDEGLFRVGTKRQSRKSNALLPKQADEKPLLPPNWYNNAYQAYMKTNHIVDLENDPGKVYHIDSVEAQDYRNTLATVHPYFSPTTKIPPLIKTLTMRQLT